MIEYYDSNILELHATMRDFAMINIESDTCSSIPEDKALKQPFVYVGISGCKWHDSFTCTEFCLVDGDYIFHSFVNSKRELHVLTVKILSKLCGKTILIDGAENAGWLWNMFFYKEGGFQLKILNVYDLHDYDTSLSNAKQFDFFCDYHSRQRCSPCALSSALWLQDLTRMNFCTCSLHKKTAVSNR